MFISFILIILFFMSEVTSELSSIEPSTSCGNSKKDIVIKRLTDLKFNSVIWSFCDLYEVEFDGDEKTSTRWDISDIFNIRPGVIRRYEHSQKYIESTQSFELKCLLCDYTSTYYTSAKSCNDMLAHIRKEHSDLCTESEIKSRKEYCNFSTTTDPTIKKIHAELTAFFVTSFISYRAVENIHFKAMLNSLNGSYVAPSRTTLQSTMLDTYYVIACNKIKEEIAKAPGVCLTLDGWSSPFTQMYYISFTVTFIRNNSLVSYILKLQQFDENHTSLNISNFIIGSVLDWRLSNFGILFIQTDNAADVLAAVQQSGNQKFGCMCHRLDKVVQKAVEDTKSFDKLVVKCQNICKKVKKFHNWNDYCSLFNNSRLEEVINYCYGSRPAGIQYF